MKRKISLEFTVERSERENPKKLNPSFYTTDKEFSDFGSINDIDYWEDELEELSKYYDETQYKISSEQKKSYSQKDCTEELMVNIIKYLCAEPQKVWNNLISQTKVLKSNHKIYFNQEIELIVPGNFDQYLPDILHICVRMLYENLYWQDLLLYQEYTDLVLDNIDNLLFYNGSFLTDFNQYYGDEIVLY